MKFVVILSLMLGTMACASHRTGKTTLNYIEYNRGYSFPTRSDLRIRSGDSDLRLHDISLEGRSFFPDDSLIPNAFIDPLLNLRISDAVKAFTEPYYGIRFFHFFRRRPNFGIGIDFIHFKVFLRFPDRPVRVSGTHEGSPIDRRALPSEYVDLLSVSHGINHVAFTLNYRWLMNPSARVPEGRLQPFVSLGIGPAIPHLELWTLASGIRQKKAYNYQIGFPNFGFNAGTGLRWKFTSGFGIYVEYKATYSLLQGMYCENEPGSRVGMSFFDHHLQWGLSFIF